MPMESSTPSTPSSHSSVYKLALYRQARMLHAYLSAFAFLALMFFAVTGLLLNHPDWFGSGRDEPRDSIIHLPLAAIQQAQQQPQPEQALAALVAKKISLHGVLKQTDLIEPDMLLHFEGVGGSSDVSIDLSSGRTEVSNSDAQFSRIIQDLHRGKNSGAAWKWLIDISAIVILALSMFGFILFFSVRFRVVVNIRLVLLSLALMIGLFLFFVP
jgi:hypothetical protein